MKKLSVVLMCMVAFLWAAPANAQFKWGLEGGVNLSKASIKGDGGLFDASNRTGWFVGPKVQMGQKLSLPLTYITMQFFFFS